MLRDIVGKVVAKVVRSASESIDAAPQERRPGKPSGRRPVTD